MKPEKKGNKVFRREKKKSPISGEREARVRADLRERGLTTRE